MKVECKERPKSSRAGQAKGGVGISFHNRVCD